MPPSMLRPQHPLPQPTPRCPPRTPSMPHPPSSHTSASPQAQEGRAGLEQAARAQKENEQLQLRLKDKERQIQLQVCVVGGG